MERRTWLTVGLGALLMAVVMAVVVAVLVLTWGPRPELRWLGEDNQLGFGETMSGLTPGQTHLLTTELRVCVDGDGEARVTEVTFDQQENLEVTGWSAIPQAEVLARPEVPEDAERTLEGRGLDRTRQTVATPCAPDAGPDHQTYVFVELRWTGGDRATASGLRMTYTGVNGRSGELVGEVRLGLCAEEADCEDLL